MAVRIRLARGGSKQRPYYRIVVADARSPRDGRFLEKVGTYNPLLTENKVTLNEDRVQYWLGVGAQPTDRVARFLTEASLAPRQELPQQTKKNQPRKKAQERMAAEAAAREAAEKAAQASEEAAAE